ncbi:MAG: hypothetical protein CMD92_00235 [Gammaproteobacteria bacterium]|nr:hypothetical protein [Gammaproteobacteria bacterium]HBW84218.1 hypothetical protein [Gammaproteobacteria bacterium]
MKKLSVLFSVVFTLMVSCAQQQIRFNNMSESELLAHNRDKPVMDQIYCEEGKVRTGSRIRRKECRKVSDWVEHNFRTQQMIQTMSVGSPFN